MNLCGGSSFDVDGSGVAVTSNVDVTNAVVRRISRHAVELMLASRAGRQAPQVELARAVQPDVARQLIGRWVSDDRTIEVRQSSRGLVLNTGYSEREIPDEYTPHCDSNCDGHYFEPRSRAACTRGSGSCWRMLWQNTTA